MAFFEASPWLYESLFKRTEKLPKCSFSGSPLLLCPRLPPAFFEILWSRAALNAHPCAPALTRHPWRVDPTPEDFKKQSRRWIEVGLLVVALLGAVTRYTCQFSLQYSDYHRNDACPDCTALKWCDIVFDFPGDLRFMFIGETNRIFIRAAMDSCRVYVVSLGNLLIETSSRFSILIVFSVPITIELTKTDGFITTDWAGLIPGIKA